MPGSGPNRIKLKRDEYIKAISIVIGILIVMVIFVLEIKYFHNTFNISGLILRAIIVGALMGGGLSYYFVKDKNEMELLDKFKIWVGSFLLSIVFFPLIASVMNHALSFNSIREEPVELVSVRAFYASAHGQLQGEKMDVTGYYIYVVKDEEIKRLKTKTNPFEDVDEKAQVLLRVRKGFWGYDYVEF